MTPPAAPAPPIAQSVPGATPLLPEAPYPGIKPFRFVDQLIFFAREEETERLIRYVTIYRGVLLYGGSGSGKSSLINAGFIPAIVGRSTVDRLRVRPRVGEEFVVERIALTNDGRPPFLPSTFADPVDPRPRVALSVSDFRARLAALADAQRPLLIFDQFEEFVTLFEEAPRGEAAEQARAAQAAILQVLVELLRDQTLKIKLLFVFREDYLAKLSKLFARAPELTDQAVRITPPRTDALREIIRGPFERFPGTFGHELSEALVEELADAIAERGRGDVLSLSEVQIACLQLWHSDDPQRLFRERGVQGLLEDYLADTLRRFPDELRDPAVALLRRLVTSSGTRNVISADDLIGRARDDSGSDEALLRRALDALEGDARLVRRELRNEMPYYEIVSEFLVPWIQRQQAERLAERLRREKADAERLLALERDAAARAQVEQQLHLERETAARQQAALRSRFYRWMAVLGAITVLLLGGVLWNIFRSRAEKGAIIAAAQAQADSTAALQDRAQAVQDSFRAELARRSRVVDSLSGRVDTDTASNAELRKLLQATQGELRAARAALVQNSISMRKTRSELDSLRVKLDPKAQYQNKSPVQSKRPE